VLSDQTIAVSIVARKWRISAHTAAFFASFRTFQAQLGYRGLVHNRNSGFLAITRFVNAQATNR